MSNNNRRQEISLLESFTGFNLKEFIIIISVAYMSILTTPMVINALNLSSLPVIIGVMMTQYYLLYYVGKLHGSSILKTMTGNGFLGWLMWLALVCMLMLPIIHLLTMAGFIPSGGTI